jgi:hypothetical protein
MYFYRLPRVLAMGFRRWRKYAWRRQSLTGKHARGSAGILTRNNPEGLKALRQLALDLDTRVQSLMIEAANVIQAPAAGGDGSTT